MPTAAAKTANIVLPIRYADRAAHLWLCHQAPWRWQGKVDLVMRLVPYSRLEPAGSLKHWDVLDRWQERIRRNRAIPPLVASLTERGTFYLHDGNHRHEALWRHFGDDVASAFVRIALLVPRCGYRFERRCFAGYATYVLAPQPQLSQRRLPACSSLIERVPALPALAPA